MTAAEKNEHYRILNERFDARAAEMRAKGFKYERIEAMNIAVFTKIRASRPMCVPATLVMNADEIVWVDELERIDRFCA